MGSELEKGPFNGGSRREQYVPPADNKYAFHQYFSEWSPAEVLLAKRIQAQSYVHMGFVEPEGLATLGEDDSGAPITILTPDIDTPVELPRHAAPYWTEYVIGYEKGSDDLSPETGKMVTWKKMYAPLDAMPAYQLSGNDLWDGWEDALRQVPPHQLVEIEAMGKTKNAGSKAIAELMKNELLRVQGKGEIWYFNIVNTTYDAFVRMWGPLAVRQVGNPRPLEHEHINKDLRLVPGVIDVDNFYRNIMNTITSPYAYKSMEMFLYMTNGIASDVLDDDIADFRDACHAGLRLREWGSGTANG